MTDLDILYEDDDLIAVNKPSGLLVHPSWLTPRGTENLASMLKVYLQSSPYTIHRLDRPTSGVILVGKNKEIAQLMNVQFAEREVKKTYLCMCRGFVPESGIIDHPLKEKLDTLAQVELPIAVGRYPQSRYSLVEVKPETGRKHQIRRHMGHISHPIAGDSKHGDGRHNKALRENFQLHRLMLMATEIELVHPRTKEPLAITAPVDQYSHQLFSQFGWQGHYPEPTPESAHQSVTEPENKDTV